MKPKICVASSGLGHVTRGIESWADDLARALHRRGHDVTLFKGSGEPGRSFESVVPCLPRSSRETGRLMRWIPRRLGWRVGMGSEYEVEQTTFAINLIRRLGRGGFDIAHVQDPLVALLVQRARRLGRVRSRAILAHGTEEPFWFQRKFVYLQQLAPWHLHEARREGVARPTWTAIPNFIDTKTFSPGVETGLRRRLGIPEDAFVVLAAAAIKRKHKRIDYLLRETELLCRMRPDIPIRLVVAGGRCDDTDELIHEGQRRLGPQRVRFLVQFPRDEMPALYRIADLFMMGSLKEMMPIALLEAIASGVPCLVHRHPVMQWMIGGGGQAVDMSGEGTVAKWMATLFDHPGHRAEMGRRARAACEAEFARDRVVDRIVDYYNFVAGGQRGIRRDLKAA
jgi:glycosyltransferase involved in cell wall biosynthesis